MKKADKIMFAIDEEIEKQVNKLADKIVDKLMKVKEIKEVLK